MRKTTSAILAIAFLFMFIALMSGCASSLDRAYTSRTIYNGGMQSLMDAKETGAISKEQFKAGVDAADQVAPVLDKLDDAALNDKPIDFEIFYADLTPKLRAFLLQAAKKGK